MLGEALAAAAIAAFEDGAPLAKLGGPLGDAARAAHARYLALPPAEQRRTRAAWAAAARAPAPPGLRGVDASWIEAALAGLPPRAREALASGAQDVVDVWLARWACAAIPPMPPIDPPRDPTGTAPRSVHDLVRLAPAALSRWLVEVGADQLAFALGSHAPRAAAVFGEVVLRAADRITRAPRDGELGGRRQATLRARVEPGPLALPVIAARAIAPHVDALARQQLAHRLPRDVGRVLARELRLHADDAIAHAPTWRALSAPVA